MVPEEIEWFQAPEVPREFNERHVFDTDGKLKDINDKEKKRTKKKNYRRRRLKCANFPRRNGVIESLARFVARNGEAFEKLAKQSKEG